MTQKLDMNPITESEIDSFVEELAWYGEECACEINHTTTTCSITVTHALDTTCVGLVRMCGTATSSKRVEIEADRFRKRKCKCGTPTYECWSIRPI